MTVVAAAAALPATPERAGEPAVLLGVDVVEVARLARAVERGGEAFARHVTTEAERGLTCEAAAFSVKECLIKAVGGRAPGFAWHDFEAVTGAPAAWAGRLLDEAAAELAAATGAALDGSAAYALHGASRDAALRRLRPPRDAAVAGAARWGSGGGLFVALAIVYVDRKESARCPR
ncbi:4'-phosphopantetheinyl transferase superfamily protein [Nonomuraea rhodomycinica]|uniref:4'-phosphopantetheinyl transferase superfamily protein n=1 Tax=Nonomuraea rhodomycinica TaxID=1712872 RepID=A0A7Y6IPX0_9ACTN|nr:4'-phosphopantetheinyl transferase superfamily protein [Nonomuraea rhodomycinica]NUW42239.1 4'-phosphopantetheinyl transferase superfamily protein [Nonomuraea rhodomycinica]